MRFLPVCLDLSSGPVALVGSGEAAINKLRLLRAAHARVRWFPINADVAEEIVMAASGPGQLEVALDDPLLADFSGSIAVVCAAGPALDEKVAARVRAQHVPINVVDRTDLSTFIFPAIVDRGDVVVAIGTSGASPVLARRLRERIEALLPARLGDLAALIGRYRSKISAAKPKVSPRLFWQQVIDGPIADAALAGRLPEAEAALELAIDDARNARSQSKTATVALVGAGPGDPDLLTLRAQQLMQDADIVFYDELVTAEILERVRRDCEHVFIGKRRGKPGIGQEEVNQRLIAAARAGKRVVRLKSGDPFVFGRGGEEIEALRSAGVPVVVVPGVTAALGCAAEAGLPLTLRNEASRLTFTTAHQAEGAAPTDWSGLGDRQTTVVVYMGLSAAAAVRDGLVAAGRDPATPAAVLARGTRQDSQAKVGRLADLPALAASVGEGPALLVVGDVVAHSIPWRAADLGRALVNVLDAA